MIRQAQPRRRRRTPQVHQLPVERTLLRPQRQAQIQRPRPSHLILPPLVRLHLRNPTLQPRAYLTKALLRSDVSSRFCCCWHSLRYASTSTVLCAAASLHRVASKQAPPIHSRMSLGAKATALACMVHGLPLCQNPPPRLFCAHRP